MTPGSAGDSVAGVELDVKTVTVPRDPGAATVALSASLSGTAMN